MEFMLAFLIATIIICCLLFFSKIYIDVTYKREGTNDYISVKVYTIKKIVIYQMQVPIIEITENNGVSWLESTVKTVKSEDETYQNREKRFIKKAAQLYSLHPTKLKHAIKEFQYYTKLYCRVIDKVLQTATCEKLCWKTIYGFEDAANTGIMTGLLWTCKAFIINRLKKHVLFVAKPTIAITPIFGQNQFDVDFQCIFSIKLGNVIKTIKSIYNINSKEEK